MPRDIRDPRAPHVALRQIGNAWAAECGPCRHAQQITHAGGVIDSAALRLYDAYVERHRHAARREVTGDVR